MQNPAAKQNSEANDSARSTAGHWASAFPIVEREDISAVTFSLTVRHPLMAKAARPGQFVIVMSHAEGERIPLTIADFDAAAGTITLVIQAVGKSTREMQRLCQVGTSLHGIAGPLGIPTPIEASTRSGAPPTIVCVGGGLGVAPVYPQARAWHDAGARVVGVLGFRNRNLVFWEKKFRDVCDELILCTDDGSAGTQGMVTDGLRLAIEAHPETSEVIAIGPPVMMRACAEVTRPHGIRTSVSLNPIMVDGTGMCGGCRVRVGGEVKFACVDGPDFDAHRVDFDDLASRLRRYGEEEAEAMAQWETVCRRAEHTQAASLASALPDARG